MRAALTRRRGACLTCWVVPPLDSSWTVVPLLCLRARANQAVSGVSDQVGRPRTLVMRGMNAMVLVVGVVMLGSLPAVARHEDDGELARARRELAEVDRGYHPRASLNAAQAQR